MKPEKLLDSSLCVINMGLSSFAHNLEETGAKVIHMDWAPPCGGDEKLMELMKRYRKHLKGDQKDA